MPVRTKELGNGALNGQTAVTLYTVPASATAIVKDISVTATTAVTAIIQIVRGAVTCRVASGAVPANGVLPITGRFIVMEPGDVLQVLTTSTPAVGHCWVSGSQLDGVA